MKISCVMTTWRRAACVQRAIACWLSQDWPGDKELIILNTDVDYPLVLSPLFDGLPIVVLNHGVDMDTGEPYMNTGAIRRDALKFATGTHYVCWDDDDIYFPWDLRQRVEGLAACAPSGAKAWKPYRSFMKQRGAAPTQEFNYMEASVLVEMDAVRKAGFRGATGSEHLAWFDDLWLTGRLIADQEAIPGYCFYWSDPTAVAGHKQSDAAEFVRLDNFERHKAGCTDKAMFPIGRRRFPDDYVDVFDDFVPALLALRTTHPEAFAKYVAPTMETASF